MTELEKTIRAGLVRYLALDENIAKSDDISFEVIEADGSLRRFIRVKRSNRRLCLAVFPADDSPAAISEAHAVYNIGSHLYNNGAAVPQLYGFDGESCMAMMEDLGYERLYDHVRELPNPFDLYVKVIDQLLQMQFEGVKGFNTKWCWDTREYDRRLMIEKESRYFESAFLKGLLGIESPIGLGEEFELLADLAGKGAMRCFLHRDCQSRNIMVDDKGIRFIDFQGGRIGPPGYDLASLLNDPYVALGKTTRDQLYGYYVDQMKSYPDADLDEFEQTYLYLALQRNLQIIGAFSFLYHRRQKEFFKQYIKPSLLNLQAYLVYTEKRQFQILKETVALSLENVNQVVNEL